METAIISGSSKTDFNLIVGIAKKIGVNVKILSESEMEDTGLALAIKAGRTKKYVNTDDFISQLRK